MDDLTLGKLYEGVTFCSDRRWFHTADIWYRFSLVVFLHYFLAITHPIAYPKFVFRYLNEWYGIPTAVCGLCFWFVYPFWVFCLEVCKRVKQQWTVDWTQAGPGSVFFARPNGFINSLCWDTYINASMMSAHFLYNGTSQEAIASSVKDLPGASTKSFWRDVVFENCGLRKARQVGTWKDNKMTLHHDPENVDLICKVEDSYLGIGDEWLTYGKDFDTKEDLEKFCQKTYANEPLVHLLEIVRPDPVWGVHSLDIVTVDTTEGPRVLSVILWTDCTGASSHTAKSGFCVCASTGKIVTPSGKWYSVAYKNQNMSHIGRIIPGVQAACREAIDAHKVVLKHSPWMAAVGWDLMLMKNEEWVWFEGNYAQARTPRRIFLTASNLYHAVKTFYGTRK